MAVIIAGLHSRAENSRRVEVAEIHHAIAS
jgi:hypothetical protein